MDIPESLTKGVNKKNVLYVGGISDDVTVDILRAAFIPFGNINDIILPMDHKTQKLKGFGFVDFELPEDAADALDNMHESEIFGRVIRCSIAKPIKNLNKAVWSSDDYHRNEENEENKNTVDGDD
ncbi:hypothetical protein RB653_008460 [Dictyostelium firmibasis]|uniref:RRM domain-containing protein n=1 Tax=Dictyostelium firmibasis TaxID=79012 RepID=A0AAN7TZ27_9MYCE